MAALRSIIPSSFSQFFQCVFQIGILDMLGRTFEIPGRMLAQMTFNHGCRILEVARIHIDLDPINLNAGSSQRINNVLLTIANTGSRRTGSGYED